MMKKKYILLLLVMISILGYGQSIWKPVMKTQNKSPLIQKTIDAKFLYKVEIESLKEILTDAPKRFSRQDGIEIVVPNIEGALEKFMLYEYSNFTPELQLAFPNIRSYVGFGVDDPTAYLRLSLSPAGIKTMVLRADKKTEFIEPYTIERDVYAVYNSHTRDKGKLPFECQTLDSEAMSNSIINRDPNSNTQDYKTYRLALSCNGEYTTYHGGTVAGALAAMNATMTRVNGVFEKDLSVHLNIIGNNSDVIYTNANTDPYSTNMTNWNSELMNTLHNVIGDNNFDIGHMFGASGGGGNAGCIGCVCSNTLATGVSGPNSDINNYKGSGITSPADGIPEGDTFDIDYVAHELGHQLGANHTFTHGYEGTGVQVEPGGGSTIMAYAGITDYNVQMNSDDYFAYRSILQIQSNLANKSCGTTTTITNQLPSLDVGGAVTIPMGTAFKLEGTADDPEGSLSLSYCWEQNDNATSAMTGSNSICFPTKTAGPNFRSLSPVSNGVRYFPNLNDVLNGNLYNMWESVLDIQRDIHFTMTVRDSDAAESVTQTVSKTVSVNSSAGPFVVTAPVLYQPVEVGADMNVNWDVANTTSAPINTQNVKLLLTTDNGDTFTTLLTSTPNDGSEVVTLPVGLSAQSAIIMIEAIDNVFFAVSSKFSIGYSVDINCNTYTYSGAAISIPDNTGSWATNTMTIPVDTNAISDVNVTLDVDHTYVADLQLAVLSPNSTQVNLWQGQCGDNDNIQVTFDDSASAVVCGTPTVGAFSPSNPLSALNGELQEGSWTIGAIDTADGDSGAINSWSIEICTAEYTSLAIDDFAFETFRVYPNPSEGVFNLSLQSNNDAKLQVQLFDMRGRLVQNDSFNQSDAIINTTLDYNSIEVGIYLLKVSKGDQIGVQQIIIK